MTDREAAFLVLGMGQALDLCQAWPWLQLPQRRAFESCLATAQRIIDGQYVHHELIQQLVQLAERFEHRRRGDHARLERPIAAQRSAPAAQLGGTGSDYGNGSSHGTE